MTSRRRLPGLTSEFIGSRNNTVNAAVRFSAQVTYGLRVEPDGYIGLNRQNENTTRKSCEICCMAVEVLLTCARTMRLLREPYRSIDCAVYESECQYTRCPSNVIVICCYYVQESAFSRLRIYHSGRNYKDRSSTSMNTLCFLIYAQGGGFIIYCCLDSLISLCRCCWSIYSQRVIAYTILAGTTRTVHVQI